MKCNKCSSEWNSTVKSELCPFCGETLEVKKHLKTIDDVFAFVFSEYGIEIINEHRRFVALLSDYAPQLNNERNLIKIALESGAYSSIVKFNDNNLNEQQVCFKRAQSVLEQKYFLSADWAQKVLLWLTNYLGWNIDFEKSNIISENQSNANQENVKSDTDAILKRAYMLLEDTNWSRATEYFERILDVSPENAEAYLGIALSEERVLTVKDLLYANKKDNKNYQRAKIFASDELKDKLKKYEEEFEDYIKKVAEQKKDKLINGVRRRQRLNGLIAVTQRYIASVRIDGTVSISSNGSDFYVGNFGTRVSRWREIVAISSRGDRMFGGLKVDGTVQILNGDETLTLPWSDIIAISAGSDHILGLKKDGTVVAYGENKYGQCNVSGWSDVIDIAAGGSHSVALKSDGSVIAVGNTEDGRCNVSSWENIVDISAGYKHTVGVKSNCTVIATGGTDEGRCNVSSWKNVVAVAAGENHTVGLRSDGRVVATKYTGSFYRGQCDVSYWSNVAAVFACAGFSAGLCSDGTISLTDYIGGDPYDNGNYSKWRLFNNINRIEIERKNAFEKRKQKDAIEKEKNDKEVLELKRRFDEEKKMEEYRANNKCQYCGGNFKGIIIKKCEKCQKKKDY